MSSPYRTFVLLAWNRRLGATIDPVGVLGLDPSTDEPEVYIAWTPLTYDRATTWRRRLAAPPTAPQIEAWLQENGTAQLQELAPTAAGPLSDVVEAVLDQLLAEVIPVLEA